MADSLIVVPVSLKDKIDTKEKSIIDKIAKKAETFYSEEKAIEDFKTLVSSKSPKTVVFYKPDIITDYKFIRAFKSLSQDSKIVLVSPQLSNLKLFANREQEVYDVVYQLLEKSSSMEISNCKISDLTIVPSKEEKDLLAKNNIISKTYDEVLEKDVEFIQKNKYLVSIVMLTYNQLADTKICVESLFKHTTDVNYELIFVDNGSTKDDTISYLDGLKKEHKNIKTIYNKENLGFACANNQGIEISEGDYVLLLNNDVILTDGWLSRMINIAESDSKIGMVVPCTNHASGRQVVTFAGTEEDDDGIQNFAKETLLKKAGNWISVSRVIGFCMLIKREVLFKVGVLDEMFGPGGYEDYDYCMRIKHENYDIVIALDTFIFHIGGKGYSSNNMDYMNLRSKNIELLIDKWTRNIIEIMEKLPDGMK
ncbi:MAG: glycosyltransferase family 2 protein [Endomicrobiaceae bacterium]|nr:glycosyltransferase family 2 protein [Endomicrobiaceae bacterium]